MNSLLVFALGIYITLSAAIIFIAIFARANGARIFSDDFSSATIGEMLLAILFLPAFLSMLLIDFVPVWISYQPFNKDKK